MKAAKPKSAKVAKPATVKPVKAAVLAVKPAKKPAKTAKSAVTPELVAKKRAGKQRAAILAAHRKGESLTKIAARLHMSRHAVTNIVHAKEQARVQMIDRVTLLRQRVARVFGKRLPNAVHKPEPVVLPKPEPVRTNLPEGLRVVDYNAMREAQVVDEAEEHLRHTTASKLPDKPGRPEK